MTIHLGRQLPAASSDRPEERSWKRAVQASLRVLPIWSCFRWGLPGPCCCQQGGALLPHHFTLTCRPKPSGGIISVALSVAARETPATPGRYPAPCFHEARTFLKCLAAPAVIRPSGDMTLGADVL